MKSTFIYSLILFTFFLAGTSSFAQKKGEPVVEVPEFVISEKTSKVVYTGVQDQKGTPGELYEKALAWAMKYYKNPSNVVREKDKEKGSLKTKARFFVFYTDPKKGTKTRTYTIEYDLHLQFKEGRYRYEITNIIYKATSYQGIEQWIDASKKQYNYKTASHLVQLDAELNKVINDFKAAIAKIEKAEEDW